MSDSYDTARKIIYLWQENVTKLSGTGRLHECVIPLYVKSDCGLLKIGDATYDSEVGIVLSIEE